MSSVNRKNSPIWSYFNVIDYDNKRARCDVCSLVMSFRGTITNLKTHLIRKHPTINLQVDSHLQRDVTCQLEKGVANQKQCYDDHDTNKITQNVHNNEYPDEVTNEQDTVDLSDVSDDILLKPKKRRKKNTSNSTTISQAFDTLKNIQESANQNSTEFNIFGNSVAAQLNSMPWENAIKLQLLIQKLITNYRLKMRRKNAETTVSTPCSTSNCSWSDDGWRT